MKIKVMIMFFIIFYVDQFGPSASQNDSLTKHI